MNLIFLLVYILDDGINARNGLYISRPESIIRNFNILSNCLTSITFERGPFLHQSDRSSGFFLDDGIHA